MGCPQFFLYNPVSWDRQILLLCHLSLSWTPPDDTSSACNWVFCTKLPMTVPIPLDNKPGLDPPNFHTFFFSPKMYLLCITFVLPVFCPSIHSPAKVMIAFASQFYHESPSLLFLIACNCVKG